MQLSALHRLNMRAEDRIRQLHMVEASQTATGFVAGQDRADLQTDQILLFAVLRAMNLIGEAAKKVSRQFVLQTPILLGKR